MSNTTKPFFQTLDEMNKKDIETNKTTVSVIPNCLTELSSLKKFISFKGRMPLTTMLLKDYLSGKKRVLLVVIDTEEFEKCSK